MASHPPPYCTRLSLDSAMDNPFLKRSQTNYDIIGEKEITREISHLDTKNTMFTLHTPSCAEAARFYVYKFNRSEPFKVYEYETEDPTIRIIRDDMSNMYKSNFLHSIMGVRIGICENAYYCIQNNTVIASITVDTLSHKIRLVSKAFYSWEVEPCAPKSKTRRRSSASSGVCKTVSSDCLSEVMTCMGLGSPPNISSFCDLTGFTVLSHGAKPGRSPTVTLPTGPRSPTSFHVPKHTASCSNLEVRVFQKTKQ